MAKRAMSFKPTPECEVQLAELMSRWKCDRTAAIIRAVAVALDANSEVDWDIKPSKIVGDWIDSDAQVVAKDTSPPPEPKLGKTVPIGKERVLTREEREAKIAAAQSWLAKGKK